MEEKSDCGGGKDRARRFSFSWADEVEREEQEEQPPPRREEKEPVKPDPFGTARPREVVLAEKGVDWRARDLELDSSRRGAACRTRARGKGDVRAAAPAPDSTSAQARGNPLGRCRRRKSGRWLVREGESFVTSTSARAAILLGGVPRRAATRPQPNGLPAKSDGSSEVGQKRMGKGRRRRKIRSNKSKKPQNLPL